MMRLLALLLVALCGAFAGVPVAFAQEARADWLEIEVNKSIVLELPQVPRALSVTNPMVADFIQLGGPQRWQIQGKSIGTTDLVIQFGGDSPPMIYEISVHRDLTDVIRRVDAQVDSEPPRVYSLNGRMVIDGVVDDLATLERLAMIGQAYDPDFVNLMRVAGDHQVQLEVVFAEISRTELRRMGINIGWSTAQIGVQALSSSTASVPLFNGLTSAVAEFAPDPTNYNVLFGILQGVNAFAQLSILDSHGLGKIIAQPTLTALSGQQAEFLAGGSIPIGFPNAQGNVVIKFRDFGTRLLFIPTVLQDDVIDLYVQIEISAIDDSIGTKLNGISVPGINTRQVVSHVRLRSGYTFAIAGLLQEKLSMTRDEVPGLGRIPVLGMFFRRISHDREETEVMVYVTPRIVRPIAPGELPPILGTTENNNPSDAALFFLGADRRAKSRTAAPTGDVGLQR
jgi:pilus assembly protein CpaC